jgi:SET domain-containing protein
MKVGGTTIDGSINGNKAKYINHSWDPNCWLDGVFVDGKHRVACLHQSLFGVELS